MQDFIIVVILAVVLIIGVRSTIKHFKNKSGCCGSIPLFFLLFTISVSFTIIPCGIVNSYGLFGEVVHSVMTEDKGQEITDIESKNYIKKQKVKGVNIINIWFEILIAMVCMIFWEYIIRLPRGDTIVTLKVRMDH